VISAGDECQAHTGATAVARAGYARPSGNRFPEGHFVFDRALPESLPGCLAVDPARPLAYEPAADRPPR
jgi:hypothetical protein